MAELFLTAFLVGLAFNAHPGPILAETLRRGLRQGFAAALAIQVGSLVGDLLWAVLGLTGLSALFLLPGARLPLQLVGSALLAWLGISSVRDGLHASTLSHEAPDRTGNALATGVLMSVGSPLNIVYWSGVAASVAAAVGTAPTPAALALFLAGFTTASLLWSLFCACAVTLLRVWITAAVLRALDVVTGLALLGFAGLSVVRTFANH